MRLRAALGEKLGHIARTSRAMRDAEMACPLSPHPKLIPKAPLLCFQPLISPNRLRLPCGTSHAYRDIQTAVAYVQRWA